MSDLSNMERLAEAQDAFDRRLPRRQPWRLQPSPSAQEEVECLQGKIYALIAKVLAEASKFDQLTPGGGDELRRACDQAEE
ncbi:hypothetical protein [Comamonas sp. JUb58]|uniref:hypothetical protein n=1 Tax=Comamonas sp. JUb58 TaxID=2485114 RepID=UPI00105F69AB|nr:hypothetical protein [Comamonas sp. JUb58]TDS82594.1 hypothetical protein EDF71_107230 [Comamonas sp. JUb58]